jgi:hypothetical protein
MIARGVRDDAACTDCGLELADEVERPAQLESAARLQVLALQPQVVPRLVARRRHQRRHTGDARDTLAGSMNVVEFNQRH